MRRAITGGPHTGKTTLAGDTAQHTDALKALDWSAASAEAARWFDNPTPDLCIEGVTVPRALRKWLTSHPTGKPVEEVVILTHPHECLTPAQQVMAKGCETVLREIAPELTRRGVRVVRR